MLGRPTEALAMDHRGLGAPPPALIDDSTAASKPLRKNRSLTRLLSASSRKFSTSRSSPTDHETRPPTPRLPAQFQPPTAKTSQPTRLPIMNFDVRMRDPLAQNRTERCADMQEEIVGKDLEQSSPQAIPKAVADKISEVVSRNTLLDLDGQGLRHSASVGYMRRSQNSTTIGHAPIYPTLPRRSKTGLRMPSNISSSPSVRGTSVAPPNAKSSLVQPQLSRPSTANSEQISRPTGKRRPSGKLAGENVTKNYFTKLDDAPPVPPNLRQGDYSNDEVRSSSRSAVTSTSSPIDTTSTERSSVLTKDTAMTDSTFDIHSRPLSKVDGMTVDEAIEMYAAGFYDDDEPQLDDPRDRSMSEEEWRRSMRIAEAVNDSISGSTITEATTAGGSTSSHAIILGDAFSTGAQQPPPILPPTSNRDQYGFLKGNHTVSIPQYDAWYNGYQPTQEKRTKKWILYMREQRLSTYLPTQFPRPSAKTERYIRKGIPPAWRGPAWFFYAGGQAYLDRHPGLYNSLVSRSEASLSSNDKEAIERDLHRTFPDNIHFKPDSHLANHYSISESPTLISLRRVLRAFALHSPRIGYCQSLNFLTGLLLLFLPEDKAFWMLHLITTIYLPGTHDISLEGANVDLWVLMVALKSTMPNIWAKVGAAGIAGDDLIGNAKLPPISLCTTSWFMSLFIGTLPIESVLRVWDILFYEGSRTLFRVALTIFKLGEQRIKDVNDSMELFQVVQGLPRGMIDAGGLITYACRRSVLSREWVDAKRRERREWYNQEKMKTPLFDVISRGEYFGQKSIGEEVKRSESIWKRRKRKGSMPSHIESNIIGAIPVPKDGLSAIGRELLAV